VPQIMAFLRNFSSPRPSPRKGPRFWAHPLERLEDRCLLSVVEILVYGSDTVFSYAGVGFREHDLGTMQAFSDDGIPDTSPGDFQAQVQWGDGTSSAGDLVFQYSNEGIAYYLIKGSHVYQNARASFAVNVTVTAAGGVSGSLPSNQFDSANVAPMPSGMPGTQPTLSGKASAPADVSIQLYGEYYPSDQAGVGVAPQYVATMQSTVNGQVDANDGDYQAFVNWGDSTTWYPAEVDFPYIIAGGHVYTTPGNNVPIVVYVAGPDGTSGTLSPDDLDYADVTSAPPSPTPTPSPAPNPTPPPPTSPTGSPTPAPPGQQIDYYNVNPGVTVPPNILPQVGELAADYYSATGRTLTITDGARSAGQQASAMLKKLNADGVEKVKRLYANKQLVRQVVQAYQSCSTNPARLAAMTQAIQNQIDDGQYISRHLQGEAVDVSSRGMTAQYRQALIQSAHSAGGRVINETGSRAGPHFHVQF
jgi:hypothetical protein